VKSDRERVDSLERTWDRIMAANPERGDANKVISPIDAGNAYIDRVEDEEVQHSSEDENLSTAYVLIATMGFDNRVGQMMAHYSEEALPQTIKKLFLALESARKASNIESYELKEQLRGMIAMVYAWAYVMRRTSQLRVRDGDIYSELLALSATKPGTEERARLTASAENKMERSTGLILQAMDDVYKQGKQNLLLFYQGSLQMLYVLSNLTYGRGASYVEPAAAS
jgi:hypothetical protein